MMAGNLMIYRGEDEVSNQPALVEFTDFTEKGMVEVKFDHKGQEFYVRFSLPQLIAEIASANGSE